MIKINFLAIFAFFLLISVTSFSATQAPKPDFLLDQGNNNSSSNSNDNFWTCYATDSAARNFPGFEKNKESALKTAFEKCSFFSETSDSCRLSQEDCEIDEL